MSSPSLLSVFLQCLPLWCSLEDSRGLLSSQPTFSSICFSSNVKSLSWIPSYLSTFPLRLHLVQPFVLALLCHGIDVVPYRPLVIWAVVDCRHWNTELNCFISLLGFEASLSPTTVTCILSCWGCWYCTLPLKSMLFFLLVHECLFFSSTLLIKLLSIYRISLEAYCWNYWT